MSGNFLLDTNVVLYILGSKIKSSELPEGDFYISFITELELLSYPELSLEEELKIKEFLGEMAVIDIDEDIKEACINLRKKYRIKLPDAIILATALTNNLTFLTKDKEIKKIKEVKFYKGI